MQTYEGFLIYYQKSPFLYVADNDVANVQQFIKDYCQSRNSQLVSEEWVIIPLKSLISKSIVKPMPVEVSTVPSRYKAVEGDIAVTVNRRCFE